jgi:hypothetical protein
MYFVAIAAVVSMGSAAWAQSATVQSNEKLITMPAPADSNSPAYWNANGLHVINSTSNAMMTSEGASPSQLGGVKALVMNPVYARPVWMESLYSDTGGVTYGWYHQEMAPCGGTNYLAEPRIGAAVSYDGGNTFLDLGTVIESGDAPDCSALNGYTAGGNGDFSVILDQTGTYFYFLYTNYGGPLARQGVAIARMPFADRGSPAGAVWKYYQGGWTQPGMGGTETPIFPAKVSWTQANTNSYWGPSIHWNTFLSSYVVLLNHSCCTTGYPQEGIYVSFNADLSKPASWTAPAKILNTPNWYPEVLGSQANGTDRLAGQTARLYIRGQSSWQITFKK